MKEKEIENYLRDRVKAIGGKAYKFVSPSNVGVPDRLVCLPYGEVIFVEIKAPGKKPTAIQCLRINELRDMGHKVFVIDSKSEVDILIAAVQERAK